MIIFLKIVAGCIIAILLLIGIVLFLLRRWFKGLLHEFDDSGATPLKIHLNENLSPEWIDKEKAAGLIQEFESLGFTRGTAYIIDEMPDVDLFSMFNGKYCATIIMHDLLGTVFDLAHYSVEDQAYAVSSNPTAGTINPMPNHEFFVDTEITPTKALEKIEEQCGSLETSVIDNENYRERTETIYKIQQTYLWNKGGITYIEFLKSSESVDPEAFSDFTEEMNRAAFIRTKISELNTWEAASLEDYFENANIDEDNDLCYPDLFIVPKKTDPEAFVHYLESFNLIHEDHVEQVGRSVREETDIEDLFNRINNARSPDIRAKLIANVTFPVTAAIYQVKD